MGSRVTGRLVRASCYSYYGGYWHWRTACVVRRGHVEDEESLAGNAKYDAESVADVEVAGLVVLEFVMPEDALNSIHCYPGGVLTLSGSVW